MRRPDGDARWRGTPAWVCQNAQWPVMSLRRLPQPGVLLLFGAVLPLLVSAAARSPLAHDAGYYALQARWMADSGQWLAPLWFSQPIFDRCLGAQWLMALSLQLFGGAPWATDLPALLAGVASLVLTAWLAQRLLPGSARERRRSALLAAGLLALTPLWLCYAHLSTQDMPLLAVELAGLSALVASDQPNARWSPLLAGLAPGLAFLIKGFMVALPVLAITPYLLIERRWLLRSGRFGLGVMLGALAVALWLGLSVQTYGLPVVQVLWQKLLFLSKSDAFSAGPLFYLGVIPATTAPWIAAAVVGSSRLWRSRLPRAGRLVLLLYPLLLLVLLSSFRTKTTYYALQLTPWIAITAAVGLQQWSAGRAGTARQVDRVIAATGGLLLLAALLLAWNGSALRSALVIRHGASASSWLAAAAAAMGIPWLLVPAQAGATRRLAALLLGPWLALVLILQSGLFSDTALFDDRRPELRRALAEPAAQRLLAQGGLQAAAAEPLSNEEHRQLIRLALATPRSPHQLLPPAAVPPGQRVWIRRRELGDPERWQLLLEGRALEDWVLAERLAGSTDRDPPEQPSRP